MFLFLFSDREPRVSTQSKNPVYRQTEVSFKQLTDSNQSSVDDMAVIRGHGWVLGVGVCVV